MGTRTGPWHSSLFLHLVPLLVLLLPRLPLSRSASVVTHLPGFHGRLPFYLETGYVGVEEETGTELFYYFVESERNPDMDPVILWLTGGPRCTDFIAIEVGPLKFVLAPYNGSLPQLVYNPYSWTKTASIIFLDSPVGAGFSYARDPKGYDVGDFLSSMQVATFMKKWFNDHPRYLSNPFYIVGSSYAGKMSPLIAQYISEGNDQRKQPVINLKGYLVGNPYTGSQFYDRNFRIPYAHGVGIISDQLYEAAKENCKGDYVNPTNNMCAGVLNTIQNLISEINEEQIIDVKCERDDLRHRFLSEEDTRLSKPSLAHTPLNCFDYRYHLSTIWANVNTTRDALRVKQGTIGKFATCNEAFPYPYELRNSIKYHFNLTSRGYRALVFSGDHDLLIPFLGTHAWIRSFNFSIIDDWRAWHLDGQSAGFTITYANHITFATLKSGGHTAIEYLPKESFAMAQRWLDNMPL